jgi:hypothetical protein
MSYEDDLADALSNARGALIDCSVTDGEFFKAYSNYKNILRYQAERYFHVMDKFSSLDELTYHSMLEELVEKLEPQALEAIVHADAGLREYIEQWTEADGLVGRMKYRIEPPNLDLF